MHMWLLSSSKTVTTASQTWEILTMNQTIFLINTISSYNQRLEKCVRCVLLLCNWHLHVFWPPTFYRHGHNLVLLKFTIKQLEIHLVWHRIDTNMRSGLRNDV